MNNKSIGWADVWALRLKIKTVVKTVILIICLDLAVSVLLSFVLSDAYYFQRFVLTDDYDDLMAKYKNNTFTIRHDEDAGWVNMPNVRQVKEKWVTDSLGSRISPLQEQVDYGTHDLSAFGQPIFLLGSSVVNGIGHKHEDTLAGQLNSELDAEKYRVYNFGVAGYTVDQSLSLYKSQLAKLKPKLLFVGIHPDAKAVSGMSGAFREGGWWPFLKPSLSLVDGEVVKVLPPYQQQFDNAFAPKLAALKQHDAYYYRLQIEKLSLLPFSRFVKDIVMKADKHFFDVEAYIQAFELQKMMMQALVDTAKEDNVEIVFVELPNRSDLETSSLKQMFYKHIFPKKTDLFIQLLKDSKYNIIYGSEVFKAANKADLTTLYLKHDDYIHFSAEGNALLVESMRQKVREILEQ